MTLVAASQLQARDVERIIPDGWRRTYESGHYAPAVCAGNMLFLSGVVGTSRDGPNGIATQSRCVFERMRGVLAEGGRRHPQLSGGSGNNG